MTYQMIAILKTMEMDQEERRKTKRKGRIIMKKRSANSNEIRKS